jgi:RHS repeat-associated protein
MYRLNRLSSFTKAKTLTRRVALVTAASFAWSFVLAPVAQALTPLPHTELTQLGHTRKLSTQEMQSIVGGQGSPPLLPPHLPATNPNAGGSYSWEGSSGGTNTGNGNKLTSIPIVGWTARGGMVVDMTLYHNSQSNHNSELGQKWTFSYDIYATVDGSGNVTIHWGNDLAYQFIKNVGGSYTAPNGIHDNLIANSSGGSIVSYDLTTKNQGKHHLTNPNGTGWYISTITDLNGNTITVNHNASDYVTSIVDPNSRTITLAYDVNNRISTITDPLSRVWTMTYTSGELTQITYPTVSGSSYNEQFAYNIGHNITTFTDKRGHNWTFNYNLTDNSLTWAKDPYSNETDYSYASGATTITDPNGHVTTHNYTSGKLSSVADPLSNSESYTYDGSNNKTQVTDRRGHNWNYTYDGSGNVLTVTDPLSHVTTMTYNGLNEVLTVTDPLSHVTTNTYDSQGRLLTVTDGLSHTVHTNTYDSNGVLATSNDALSHQTTFSPDTYGNFTTVTDANSNATTATYNTLGVKLTVTDALSHTTTDTLDNWNRVTGVSITGNTVSTTAYDANSNVTSVTDGASHSTTTVYDSANRPTSATKANSDAVTYAYDATGKKGLLSSKTDGNSHTTTYSYTNRNQISSVSYADSTSESFTYDANGKKASHTDGKGNTVSYTNDNANRITLIDYPTGTDTSFSYDNANRQTGMTDSTGTTTWNFDAANRASSFTNPNGTVTYTYDNADRRTQIALTGTGNWTYSYDSGNRITSSTNPYSETSSWSYDAANRVTQLTAANSSLTTYGYDSMNRTTDVWHKTNASPAVTLGRYQYTYDAASNVSTRADNDGSTTTYGYDNAHQLTSDVRTGTGGNNYSISYTYDGNSNRATKVLGGVTDTYSYDSHDKLTGFSRGGTNIKTYAYDNNGNCTSVTVVAGSLVTSLSYDYENRVTGITYPSAATNSFQYNGLDLRMQKVDSGGTVNYICDGTDPASAVLADTNATYTPGLSERRSGTSKFLHSDALGTTRGITNSSQTATDGLLFDAFGMSVSRTGTTPTPFGFVGSAQYETDTDSGLMLLGHRYYDSSIGRFITQDPARSGNNWFAYCSNNPSGCIDPSGLVTIGGFEFTWATISGGLETSGAALLNLVSAGHWCASYENDPGFSASKVFWGVAIVAASSAAVAGSFATGYAQAICWSGRGAKVLAEAEAIVSGGLTIGMTAGGQVVTMINGVVGDKIAQPIWSLASWIFVRVSSGPVTAIIRDPRPGGIWLNVELPYLLNTGRDIIYK